MAARRSKAGFERVHDELLRGYITGDKHTRRMSFWKKKPRDRNHSMSTLIPLTSSFRSYLDDPESDPELTDATKADADGNTAVAGKFNIDRIRHASGDKIDDKQCSVSASAETLPSISPSSSVVDTESSVTGKKHDGVGKTGSENLPNACGQAATQKATIYDTPSATVRRLSVPEPELEASDHYIQMDDVDLTTDLSGDESNDYTNVQELLQLKKAAKPPSSIYVNCTKEMLRKQSTEKSLEIYASTEFVPVDEVYAKVNKSNKKKIDKIERESQHDDYIFCDNIDTIPKPAPMPKLHNKQQTLDSSVSARPELKRQTLVQSPEARVHNKAGDATDDDYMSMSGDVSEEPEFYSFSVEEVVEVLQSCALPHLADICQEENLDGAFFRNIDKEELCNEPFRMNWFYINKFFRVINGWRPKRMRISTLIVK